MEEFVGGYKAGVMDALGGYGTVAGADKNKWLDFIREEREQERTQRVPKRQRRYLDEMDADYHRVLDKRALAKKPKYSERALRPRRAGGPRPLNTWMVYLRDDRARNGKRPLQAVAADYRRDFKLPPKQYRSRPRRHGVTQRSAMEDDEYFPIKIPGRDERSPMQRLLDYEAEQPEG